jgi:hypothetical protein
MVGAPRGAREVIERQAEAAIDVGLHGMLARAIRRDRQALGLGGELGRCAVLVGAAQEQHLVSGLAPETGVDVGGQQRAREIAEMLYAVDVRKRAGDQEFGHGSLRVCRQQKALRAEGLERPFGPSVPARHASAPSGRRGRRIRRKRARNVVMRSM